MTQLLELPETTTEQPPTEVATEVVPAEPPSTMGPTDLALVGVSDDRDEEEIGTSDDPTDAPATPASGTTWEQKREAAIADIDDRIHATELEVCDYAIKVEEAEELKKSMQKFFDEAVDRLRRLKSDRRHEEGREPEAAPLFDDPSLRSAPVPTEDTAWRSVRLDSLSPAIKPGKLKALAEAEPPILTLGDLTDFQKQGEWWAKKVKGLGDGGMEQIAAAADAYWAANPRIKSGDSGIKTANSGINGAEVGIKGADSGISDGAFDDGAIDLTTLKQIINNPERLQITVGQRVGGQWSAKYFVSLGKDSMQSDQMGTHEPFVGRYPSDAEAIVAACDAVDQFVHGKLNGKLPKKARDQALEIRRILDRIDKSTASASPEAAKAVAEGLPDPTPRDAKGKIRFKGNKRK